MAEPLTGGCLCGAVRYEVHEPLRITYCCHCSRCRRFSGSAFAANAGIRRESLRIVQGEELLRAFEEEGYSPKAFCSICGSSLFGLGTGGDFMSVRMGTLDDGYGAAPRYHIYAASKASWCEIMDDCPKWDELPE